jgi:hypothetical protein
MSGGFYSDPVFWIALAVLEGYWLWGLWYAYKNDMLLPMDLMVKGLSRGGIVWSGHAGFWFMLVFLHPVLAYATAKMWPLWQVRGDLLVFCMILGGIIGFVLQTKGSREAGSSDTWSMDGRPSSAGIVHIMHTHVEIGIMLMLLVSGVWYHEVPVRLFFGVLCMVLCHFLVGGTHWPIRMYKHKCWWAPNDMRELGKYETVSLGGVSALLLGSGLTMLAMI